jgi:hypothetical protein
MSCYIDTTIVVKVAERDPLIAKKAIEHASKNNPAQVPHYAYREMSAGVLYRLCSLQQRIATSENPAEALAGILRLPPQSGRNREGPLQEFQKSLFNALQVNGVGAEPIYKTIRDEMSSELALKAQRLWRRATRAKEFTPVDPLSCFQVQDLEIDELTGAVFPTTGRFGCTPGIKCAAAKYLIEKRDEVQKLVDFLRPDADSGEKQETSSRRKALKELLKLGASEFPRKRCRGLGDAYFAIRCPPGSHVLTTNLADHEPLCNSLGKSARCP